MCGIAGVLSLASSPENRSIVERIVQDQLSRGPDLQSTEEINASPQLIFGHDRLSIIDLSLNARQPMWDMRRRFCIVFNGEIYNYLELRTELLALGHTFHSASDTEVILESVAQWGLAAAINRFNGMFAFALFDSLTKRLFLVRDRFGVKPLYYHTAADRLIFASTTREIAKSFRLRPSVEYVVRGLQYGVYEDETDSTQYEGLKAVLPSHYVEVAVENHSIESKAHRYYDLKSRVQELRSTTHQLARGTLIEMVGTTLSNAVDLRLRSDVPVGIALSGGLDSSTIAALLSSRHHQITGFCFGDPNDDTTEGPTVARAARQLGFEVEFIRPSISELTTAFWSTLEAQDAPFVGGNIVAQQLVFQAAQRRRVPVVLGGQGADEVFMGYLKFQFFALQAVARQRQLTKMVTSTVGMLSAIGSQLRNFDVLWNRRHAYLKRTNKQSSGVKWPKADLFLGYDPDEPLWYRQLKDTVSFSLPTLLRYDDRTSMANSVENRLPFLDYRIVELGIALPDDVKVRNGFGKWIVRQVGKGIVPDHIRLNRTKSHFNVPQKAWVAAGLGKAIRQRLHDRYATISQFLNCEDQIETVFSDPSLQHDPTFHEAIGLLWLGTRV